MPNFELAAFQRGRSRPLRPAAFSAPLSDHIAAKQQRCLDYAASPRSCCFWRHWDAVLAGRQVRTVFER